MIIGHYIAKTLKNFGINRIYGVAGESFLPILDGCHEYGIEFISARHESAAAMMAVAEGKITNRPGVVMVTRGPGAMHGAVGVHIADEEGTPLIYLIGQAQSHLRHKGAFQEMEFTDIFASFSKFSHELHQPNQIDGLLERAWLSAMNGRAGASILSFCEDILYQETHLVCPKNPPHINAIMAPPDVMSQLFFALQNAHHPLLILGGGSWYEDGLQAVQSFAHLWHIPVLTSFRRFDYFNNFHHCYAGRMGLGQAPHIPELIAKSDVIITVGCELRDIDTQGGKNFDSLHDGAQIFHIVDDANMIGRLISGDVNVIADYNQFAHALSLMPHEFDDDTPPIWVEWTQLCHQQYKDFASLDDDNANLLAQSVVFLQQILPQGTITTSGAGNYNYHLQRYWKYSRYLSFFGPINGVMGYSINAAIAAAFEMPARNVVCFAGDGCAMMSIGELSTIASHQLPILIIIANNNMLGTIDMHQNNSFQGRHIGVAQHNPDFVALAQSFGIKAAIASNIAELQHAVESIIKKSRITEPLLIELQLDGDNLSPTV